MSDIDVEILGLWEGCPCENCMFLRSIQSKWRKRLFEWVKLNYYDSKI